MRGRLTAVSVSSTSVLLASRNPNRTSISFSPGDALNSCSVVLKDLMAATATNGFPLVSGRVLHLEGEIATHEFNAIRLAAVDCLVGVIEGFPDGTVGLVEADEPVSGVPTL